MTRFPVLRDPVDGDDIVQITGYRDLRAVARDWSRFSSDALGRIQIPAEDQTRDFRQYPIESDPPRHIGYRSLIQFLFNKPLDPAYAARIEALVDDMVTRALAAPEVEVVEGFALPLQSRALAHLLGMPQSEADRWIGWGLHAFRTEAGYDLVRARHLVEYLQSCLDRAPDLWPDSLFAFLRDARIDGRPLTRDEQMGYSHLVFAGGRDTVIRLISGGLAHLAQTPEALARLRADPALAATATEELVRYLSPLPLLGRICRHDTDLDGQPIAAGQRLALCFAQANRDPDIFPDPDRLQIDRRPNPHVGFGSGPHSCPGSGHARLLSRTVLLAIARRVQGIAPAPGENATGLGFSRFRIRLT
ncbi:cytochrome P450 [Tabrizicola sp. TH137]|uniref:cytochrome P450 n=1 Tax=Tabrizicola sp. TH137 TaxID=2067452 RepID=UPI000C7C1B7B|nr:cytochrome P450 [Tabrizicola sp. TH137]PLL12634.1 cytochrome P450 [Tabrizicola sp. TH137]